MSLAAPMFNLTEDELRGIVVLNTDSVLSFVSALLPLVLPEVESVFFDSPLLAVFSDALVVIFFVVVP